MKIILPGLAIHACMLFAAAITNTPLQTAVFSTNKAATGNYAQLIVQKQNKYAANTMLWAPGDTILVGAGNTYTSLTKAGGLFQALNNGSLTLTKDITVAITSDLTEDGSNFLTNANLNGYRLTIKPSADTIRNISNTTNLGNSMITVSGAKKVVIDGRYNGSGRYLRFVNTHTAPLQCKSTFHILGSADSVVLNNIIAESNERLDFFNSGNPAAIVFVNTGNNKNIIINESMLREATTGTTGYPEIAILSLSEGNGLTVTNNDIANFKYRGVDLESTADSAIIRGNHLYYNMPTPAGFSQTAIKIVNGRKHRIENNYIGGSSRNCGGAVWLNNGNMTDSVNGSLEFAAIDVSTSATDTCFIRNNTIQNIKINAIPGVFTGIVGYGTLVITGNNIGHPSNPNDISNSGNNFSTYTRGMNLGNSGSLDVSNNTIANITSTGTGSPVSVALHGIFIGGNAFAKVTNNTIYNLQSSSGNNYLSGNASVTGIYLWSGMNGYLCEGNTIHSLKAVNSDINVNAMGIRVFAATTGSLNRNKIYNLQSLSSRGGSIVGIYIESTGSYRLSNNQVALTNGTNTNKITIRGINYSAGNNTGSYYYNTIYIGGSTPDTSNSYGLSVAGNTGTAKCFNNIFYNERTSGTGVHYPISVVVGNLSTNWNSRCSNYNLFVSTDTARMGEWGLCCTGTSQSMRQWKASSNGDTSSYAALNTKIPAARLFANSAVGNLNINTNDSICWYANAKGMPVAGISADYDDAGTARSVNPAAGPVDIGADEFNTNTHTFPLEMYGNHQPGGADTLSHSGRIMAIIKWGNTGTLPVMGTAKWQSGVWPNDTTNNGTVANARYMSGYLDIPASGGSNYSYSFTMYYDSAMSGRVANIASMLLHKRQSGTAGSWINFPSTTVNTTSKTITVSNLNSFSEFTAADANAPLSTGVQSFCPGANTTLTSPLSGTVYQWQLDAGTGFGDITNNSNFSGSNTPTLQIANLPSAWHGYKLRCMVDGANTAITAIRFTNSWTGAADSAWENTANWSCGTVPDAGTNVAISSGTVVLHSNATIRTLTLAPGVVFTIHPGFLLTITN
jgi:hypothetical protein